MPKIFRPKRPSELDPLLLKEKIKRDTEYEFAVRELYNTLPREQAQAKKAVLWSAYEDWAKQAGLYEKVTLEQQVIEAEANLREQLEIANQLRAEANIQTPLRIVS